MSHFNTTNLSGDDLKKADKKALSQEMNLYERIRWVKGEKWTARDFMKITGYEICTVSRMIRNLTAKGLLVKSSGTIQGEKAMVHYWTLA